MGGIKMSEYTNDALNPIAVPSYLSSDENYGISLAACNGTSECGGANSECA